MRISLIICTYNRCQRLTAALESAAALRVPESIEWEILVVDNNSRDQTHNVVEDFCRRYPGRFRYLLESQQGKSHALNAGIRQAYGEILAFTDDDVTFEPTWLWNLTKPLSSEEWAGAGGRVLPKWSRLPPRWMTLNTRHALAPLAGFDLGEDPFQLTEPPFGVNMAFRKSICEKYGGFRTDLGPSPENEIRGEDTEFGYRLLTAGERLRYEPSAVVYHPVPDIRLQKRFFLSWHFDHGRACIRIHGTPANTRNCWGVPLVFFRRVVKWTLRWMVALSPRLRFAYKCNVWMNAGMILESFRSRFRRNGAVNAIVAY
jgi:glucosyl-dolichyl phosphate glucuronosyltransferase